MNVAASEDDVGERHPDVTHASDSLRSAERTQRAGHLAGARVGFAAALDAARRIADPELFARAALGLGGVWVHEHRSAIDRAHVMAFQRQALQRVDPHSAIAVRLRTRLAAEESYVTGDPTAVLDALEAARASDDAVALAEALSLAHHCLLGPDHGAERRALADELIEVSGITGRALDASMGLLWQTVDLFLAADPHADRALQQLRSRDTEDCVRYVVDALEVMQTIRAGELERAEKLAAECYEFGVSVGDADALGWYGAQLVSIYWHQGRGIDLLPYLTDVRESPTLAEPNDAFDAAFAVLAAGAGRSDDARAALHRLRTRGLTTMRNSSAWLVKMLGVIEAAHLLGDAGAAREAYAALAPYARLPAMGSLAIACFGSVHRPLGIAAATFGDLELAVAHLELAVDADLAFGNRPCHAMSSAALSDVLQRRGGDRDRERAAAMRRSAIATAEHCEMSERANAWRATLDASGAVVCHREGRMWRVQAEGRSVLVPDSIGMQYLARLIASPGVEIAAVQLVGEQHAVVTARHDMVDNRAVAAYRHRLTELQADIDDAEDACDIERAARARAEFDAIVDEVGRATGLLGRRRAFTDEVERARTSVQKALKRALARIAEADAGIADHLAARVVTGTSCLYAPRGV